MGTRCVHARALAQRSQHQFIQQMEANYAPAMQMPPPPPLAATRQEPTGAPAHASEADGGADGGAAPSGADRGPTEEPTDDTPEKPKEEEPAVPTEKEPSEEPAEEQEPRKFEQVMQEYMETLVLGQQVLSEKIAFLSTDIAEMKLNVQKIKNAMSMSSSSSLTGSASRASRQWSSVGWGEGDSSQA